MCAPSILEDQHSATLLILRTGQAAMSFLTARRPSVNIPSAGEQPGPSILLNPEEGSPDLARLTPSRSRNTIRRYSSTPSRSSVTTISPSIVIPPRTPNIASESGSGTSGPASCSKVSFAPLPERPPELRRRSSITLGVAARKNLLGVGAGRPPGQQKRVGAGGTAVWMTDEEWAEYKETHFPP